jgi:hypothetical protein
MRRRRLEGVGRTSESQMLAFQVMLAVLGIENAPGGVSTEGKKGVKGDLTPNLGREAEAVYHSGHAD